MKIHIGVDVGGTFTDIAVNIPEQNQLILHKLPSTPTEPHRSIIEGIQTVLDLHRLDAADVEHLAHGTTVGTNALIERRCGRVAVVTTDGFRDLLQIGRQTRPKVYDLHLDNPEPLVPRQLRFEVSERRLGNGDIFRPLDEAGVKEIVPRLLEAAVDCVVVCFLHSYAYPEHEERAAAILCEGLGEAVTVITSSAAYPEFREYERFSTAVLNGALLTVMNRYLDGFTKEIRDLGIKAPVKVSQSTGGLMSVDKVRELPIRASLSGPAAGVIGAAHRAQEAGFANIITLDVGGTSADVSLLMDGQPAEISERSLAGFPLRMPALDVNAVGAGGGSIAWIGRDGLLKVGPKSAGAVPGPACYGEGGKEATVTDANVVTGRLNGEALLDGSMVIDKRLAEQAVATLAHKLGLDADETGLGIIRIVAATMVKAIRSISIERGLDPADFALFVFGGAGPLHATEVARELGIGTVIVPPHPGILCAEGLLNSDLALDFVQTLLLPLVSENLQAIAHLRFDLAQRAAAWLQTEGADEAGCHQALVADLRYVGQNYELSLPLSDVPSTKDELLALEAVFHAAHEQSYGFASEGETIELVNLKIKARVAPKASALPHLEPKALGLPFQERDVLFAKEAHHRTLVFRRNDLAPEQIIEGPAVIEQMDSTTIVYPGDRCRVDHLGNLILDLKKSGLQEDALPEGARS